MRTLQGFLLVRLLCMLRLNAQCSRVLLRGQAFNPAKLLLKLFSLGTDRSDAWPTGNLLSLLRSGIDNWTDFKASNNIQGWDNSTLCSWTGIVCNSQGLVQEMYVTSAQNLGKFFSCISCLCCMQSTYCAVAGNSEIFTQILTTLRE